MSSGSPLVERKEVTKLKAKIERRSWKRPSRRVGKSRRCGRWGRSACSPSETNCIACWWRLSLLSEFSRRTADLASLYMVSVALALSLVSVASEAGSEKIAKRLLAQATSGTTRSLPALLRRW